MPWSSVKFSDAIGPTTVGRENQILSANIQSSGRFPVVDQGQAFIAGYSDDTDRVIRDDLPLIIFGDHTRCVKYVDFAFILGADGTKVLKPKADLFEPKFFFYALLNLDIPNRGYNRHFTVLKENSIPCPEKHEQRSIVRVLDVVQRASEQQEQVLQLTTELKGAILHKLFTQGIRGSASKKTDLGLVPDYWEVHRLDEFCELKSGGTPNRSRADYWTDGDIPWVKTGEVDYCLISDTEEKITAAGLANSSARIFPCGTLLMAMYGQGITRGKVGILGIDAATNQACVAFFPSDKVRSKFLYYLFEYRYEKIRDLGHGANQKNLSAEILKGLTVASPIDHDEQDKIVNTLEQLDVKLSIVRRKHKLFGDLFKTLLHRLMSAQISVHDLDLPELESAAAA